MSEIYVTQSSAAFVNESLAHAGRCGERASSSDEDMIGISAVAFGFVPEVSRREKVHWTAKRFIFSRR